MDEVGVGEWRTLWLRGGFPRSFLSGDDASSALWREDFIRSHLERDIPALGISIPAETLRRFWMMVSHYHGRTLNLSELGRSFGVSDHTVRRYLDILSGTYMIRLLPPRHANVGKRLVKVANCTRRGVRSNGLTNGLTRPTRGKVILVSVPSGGGRTDCYHARATSRAIESRIPARCGTAAARRPRIVIDHIGSRR